MSEPRRRGLKVTIWVSVVLVGIAAFAIFVVSNANRLIASFEPVIREQAVMYLRERFHSDVQLAKLDVTLPRFSAWKLWRTKGRGSMATVAGSGLVLRPDGRPDLPPLLKVAAFRFEIDLGILASTTPHIPLVVLDGVELVVPPKGQRAHIAMGQREAAPVDETAADRPDEDGGGQVVFDTIQLHNSLLIILPKQADRIPLRFTLQDVKLTNAGAGQAMDYDAVLRNPRPDGWIHSQGKFGPFDAEQPGDTPLGGVYQFKDANLGVFKTISGILQSTGEFQGTLSQVSAKGEAHVPDFRLKRRGRSMPLYTQFEALVDGTNGNTTLKPVRARLGTTNFVTSGAIIKREKAGKRSIRLAVNVPKGEISDFLKLAATGEPIMAGAIALNFTIDVPPLDGSVKEKLILDGMFRLTEAHFLRDSVATKIEELSQRGQGKPGQDSSGETLSQFRGRFHLEDQQLGLQDLRFSVPGANVELAGKYDMAADALDFHGALKLDAKVSRTLTGWKRWAAKPLDPIFAKNGAGTYLRIQVTGPAKHPSFGRDKQPGSKSDQQ